MRKLSAHYIFPAHRPPLKYGILVLDDEGRVVELIDTGGKLKEESNLEFYSGILIPGFVNAHCHLELSHLRNRIPRRTGISAFVEKVAESRMEEKDKIDREIRDRAAEMYRSGIAVVGDIVNTDDTLPAKLDSPVYWHSFVELFGLQSKEANRIWQRGKALKKKFEQSGLSASMSPHAPYSVSRELWEHFKSDRPEFITMHSQESREEEELMSNREGKMAGWFQKKGFNIESLPQMKRSSLESVMEFLPQVKRILLVHNTHTKKDDIDSIFTRFQDDQVFWVLCPNSNLYIENSLPEGMISNRKGLQICLGTDSLASNSSLSLLEEMKTLQQHFPSLGLEEIIGWSSLNGARALGAEGKYGSFEAGKQPGVVLIDHISYPGPSLTHQSRSVRLV